MEERVDLPSLKEIKVLPEEETQSILLFFRPSLTIQSYVALLSLQTAGKSRKYTHLSDGTELFTRPGLIGGVA